MKIKTIARFSAVIISIAFLISFLIFYFYQLQNKEERIEKLSDLENTIKDRCGISTEKFRLCSYPQLDSISNISWYEDSSSLGTSFLKINFDKTNIENYYGIYCHLTIFLLPYLENGILEFQAKTDRYLPEVDLGVYLMENLNINKIVFSSVLAKMNEEWQLFSFPLRDFSPATKVDLQDKKFSWEVLEILFSLNPLNHEKPVILFVKDLKVISDNKVIYDLF